MQKEMRKQIPFLQNGMLMNRNNPMLEFLFQDHQSTLDHIDIQISWLD